MKNNIIVDLTDSFSQRTINLNKDDFIGKPLDPELQTNQIFNYDQIANLFKKNPEGVDSNIIEETLFPYLPKRDIFISHYHKDKDLAIYLANKIWGKEKKSSFIDGELWGNVYEIIDLLEENFDKQSVYSHFLPLLIKCLEDQIDSCDTFIFLNTYKKEETNSPWIFTELQKASASSGLNRRSNSIGFSYQKPPIKINYFIKDLIDQDSWKEGKKEDFFKFLDFGKMVFYGPSLKFRVLN